MQFLSTLEAATAVLSAFPALVSTSYVSQEKPQVDLGYATYEGTSLAAGVNQFLGMRYAAPPLGDLRFRAPRDPLQEYDKLNAIEHGKICLAVGNAGPPLPSGEDCLFVDVYTPSSATPDSKLSVMVWLQGGALIELVNPNYNGTQLVKASKSNVIIVSFNYRVGPYGFLTSQEVSKDGDLNVGFLDQRKALEWVAKHIKAFGGDPDKVTIFGTSVGNVLFQMLAYGGQETSLFRAGISASAFLPAVHQVSDLEFQYKQLLNATDCDSLSCLRGLSTDDLQRANIARPYSGEAQPPLFPYGPVIDGSFLQDHPTKLLAAGKFVKKPLMTGTSRTEGTIFAPAANTTQDISNFIKTQLPDLTAKDLIAINNEYADVLANQSPAGVTSPKAPLFYRAAAAYGDSQYSCAAYTAANAFSAAGVPTFFFRDNIRDPVEVATGIIVPHTWDTIAYWGPSLSNVNYAGTSGSDSYESSNSAIVPVAQAYWTSFARTGGDPNTFRSPESALWKKYNCGEILRLQTNATGLENISEDQLLRCAFWSALEPRTHL